MNCSIKKPRVSLPHIQVNPSFLRSLASVPEKMLSLSPEQIAAPVQNPAVWVGSTFSVADSKLKHQEEFFLVVVFLFCFFSLLQYSASIWLQMPSSGKTSLKKSELAFQPRATHSRLSCTPRSRTHLRPCGWFVI